MGELISRDLKHHNEIIHTFFYFLKGSDYAIEFTRTRYESLGVKVPCHPVPDYSRETCAMTYAEQTVAKKYGCRVPWMDQEDFPHLGLCNGSSSPQPMWNAVEQFENAKRNAGSLVVLCHFCRNNWFCMRSS